MPKVDKDNYKPYFDIEISKAYKPDTREAIAQEIIDTIATRSESGIDADGKKFVGYSKKYAAEKGQKNVDLTFSGDMLAAIEMLQNNNGKIRIGYDKGYDGLGKVEGNIKGTYGNDAPINKGRNFLGITDTELKRILKNYPLDNQDVATETSKQVTQAAKTLAGSSDIGTEEE